MTTKRQYYSGATLEQAVLAAAREFELAPEEVAYTVRDKKHGFLKVRRRIVIEVDPEAPARRDQSPGQELEAPMSLERQVRAVQSPHRATESWPRAAGAGDEADLEDVPEAGIDDLGDDFEDDSEDDFEDDFEDDEPQPDVAPDGRPIEDEVEPLEDLPLDLSENEAVERAMREVLRFLRVEPEIEVRDGEDGIFAVELTGPGYEVLTEDDGRLLHEMDYLVPRLVRGLRGEAVACKVDFEGFRVEREEELRRVALAVADEVGADGGSQLLEPMSPADRRVVHMALAERSDVETESEGDGYFKRVRVSAAGPA